MKELGGEAKWRVPKEPRGETIERKGQRVMAVRGRSERLLQTTLLDARAGVWSGFGRRLLGVRQGPGAERTLSVTFHA